MPESVLFGCVSRTLFRVLMLTFEFWLAVLRLCELSLLLVGLCVLRLVACRWLVGVGRLTASEPTARLLVFADRSGRAVEFMAVCGSSGQA